MNSTVKLLFVLGLGMAAGAIVPGEAVGRQTCRMTGPDVSVSGLTLGDAESAKAVVGTGAELIETTDDFPQARFVSKDGAEELVLFASFGAALDEYTAVEVRAAGSEALALKDLPVEAFVTGRGVRLGMSPAEVTRRFGKCKKSHERSGGSETIRYEDDEAKSDPALKTFGYPVYYAEYDFEEGRLVRFRFGFDDP
jgi:hypothetical protein